MEEAAKRAEAERKKRYKEIKASAHEREQRALERKEKKKLQKELALKTEQEMQEQEKKRLIEVQVQSSLTVSLSDASRPHGCTLAPLCLALSLGYLRLQTHTCAMMFHTGALTCLARHPLPTPPSPQRTPIGQWGTTNLGASGA